MATVYHKDQGVGEIHIAYQWSYATATARTGATGFVAGDVGKLARQLSDDTLWMLTATTPTWAAVGAAPGSYYAPGGTDVAVTDGGTGASTASGARTNLGVAIGTDVEAHNADLTTIAGLTPTNDDLLQRKSGAWINRTPAQVKVDLAVVPGDVAGFDAQVRTSRLDQLAAPTADVSLNGHKATNLATPTASGDAATKGYADGLVSGVTLGAIKEPVRVATTASGTLATAYANGSTVDGVALVTGDRLLLKDQATGSENGIYVVAASGAPARAADFDTSGEVEGGALVVVQEGTANADRLFVLTTNAPITLGTTALTFAGIGSLTGALLAANNLSDVASAVTARLNLGLVVGTDVQAHDADLDTIAALTATTDSFLQAKASAWAARTPTQVTADLIAMMGDSGAGGTKGLVPAPSAGDAAAGKYLNADGTFSVPAGGGGGTTLPLTAQGDLVVGTSAVYTDQAAGHTVAVQDTFSGSGANIVDGNDSTAWAGSTHFGGGTAPWFSIDLGSAKAIGAFRLLNGPSGNAATQFNVQYSDDNATWTTAYTSASGLAGGDTGIVGLGSTLTHRYWKFNGVAGSSGNGWNVTDAKLYVITAAGAAARLPVGADAMLLAADSTQTLGVRWRTILALLGFTTKGDLLAAGGTSAVDQAHALGTASASSSYGSTFPGRAIDANDATEWWSDVGSALNRWLAVDLGAAVPLDTFRVMQHTADPNARTSAYRIQYSTDNVAWNTAYQYSSAAPYDSGQVTMTTPATARYWRIIADAASTNGFGIQSFELYNLNGLILERVAVGSDGQALLADSSAASGVSWQAALKSLGSQTVGTSQIAVTHGLGYAPTVCIAQLTSAGQVWRSAASDGTNIYLQADAAGRTCQVYVR